mmetsp:Transcript_15632/g.33750  ORF Transcript_15632/g.33750 Transcript_15632/m.33750 type:complete len:172 (-) Transcript_15632:29-544(-)
MDSDGAVAAVAAAAGGGPTEADDSGTLPGASSLVEQLNRHVLVCLRDGRNILGWLRSFDQFANLVLDKAVERVVVESSFGDIPLGIFMIRGENVMLLAEVRQSSPSPKTHSHSTPVHCASLSSFAPFTYEICSLSHSLSLTHMQTQAHGEYDEFHADCYGNCSRLIRVGSI